MNEHESIIKAYSGQIMALLDLMSCSNKRADQESMKTAAAMCMTMHLELMQEVDNVFIDLCKND